jgi:hypothetical protein
LTLYVPATMHMARKMESKLFMVLWRGGEGKTRVRK